ncbi:hypothetical protein E2C01_077024 [Portunus trituberculatus]|uniref:Uncharacterized protein n=1 Tax=Portunus trituberculatus TaxID=210409 RepID=A0A5B7IJA5_PORTR|nr:hypothetical protein [Portunus trituberculatus]
MQQWCGLQALEKDLTRKRVKKIRKDREDCYKDGTETKDMKN